MMDEQRRETLLTKAIDLARENVDGGGRPFACVIANDAGEELARKADAVQQTGDPTAQGGWQFNSTRKYARLFEE